MTAMRPYFPIHEQFDHAVIDASTIRVTEEEIEEAMRAVEPGLLEVMKRSMKNIRAFHEKQKHLQLVRQQTGRNDSGTEDDGPLPASASTCRAARRRIRPPF